jgi:integrase
VESYRQHFNDHILAYVGAVKLADLTVPMVREFGDRLRADKRSPAMIKRVIGVTSVPSSPTRRNAASLPRTSSIACLRKKQRQAERRQCSALKVGCRRCDLICTARLPN